MYASFISVILCLSVVLCSGLSIPTSLTENATSATTFGIVIDAGSTGSRVHIYEWEVREFTTIPPPTSLPIKTESSGYRLSIPLASPEGLNSLETLLNETESRLQKHSANFSKFPIMVYATAGMRILEEKTREDLMSKVRSRLHKSKFYFKDEWARVISGEEEGVFGLLSVNHDFFLNKTSKWFGALDLGGASTQISFIPRAGSTILANMFNIQIGQVNENAYTHSYLYYGKNMAVQRINAVIASKKENKVKDFILNPCYNMRIFNYTFSSSRTVTFIGTGNYTECRQVASEIMYKDTVCLTDPLKDVYIQEEEMRGQSVRADYETNSTCAINGVYQASFDDDTQFVAFSTFKYIWEFLKLRSISSIAELSAAATAECSISFELLQQKHSSVPEKYLKEYCIASAYAASLLNVGYGIGEFETRIQVNTKSKYGWTLGAILTEANRLPWTYKDE